MALVRLPDAGERGGQVVTDAPAAWVLNVWTRDPGALLGRFLVDA